MMEGRIVNTQENSIESDTILKLKLEAEDVMMNVKSGYTLLEESKLEREDSW